MAEGQFFPRKWQPRPFVGLEFRGGIAEDEKDMKRTFGLALQVFWFGFFSVASFGATNSTPIEFDARSVRNGRWSDPKTWMNRDIPKAGDSVQIRPGHSVIYDLNSDQALRTV